MSSGRVRSNGKLQDGRKRRNRSGGFTSAEYKLYFELKEMWDTLNVHLLYVDRENVKRESSNTR
jgi:hypothetical protein